MLTINVAKNFAGKSYVKLDLNPGEFLVCQCNTQTFNY